MEIILKGLGLGIVLAILVGPILFALIQVGIERGIRAGLSVGLGIWISDLLFIIGTYWGVASIANIVEGKAFQLGMGIIGGIVLIIIGVGTMLKTPPNYDQTNKDTSFAKSFLSFFMMGFIINTVNPFTISFWTSIMITDVLNNQYTNGQATLFLGSILFVIVSTDTLKVVLAKKIRPYLKANYLILVRRVAGVALILFGIIMMIRVAAF